MTSIWDPGFRLQRHLATADLLVGEWRCAGIGGAAAEHEESRHVEITIQRIGSHTRTTGRERNVAAPGHAALQDAGDRYLLAHPAARPEHSTVILLSTDVVAAAGGLSRRGARLSPASALAHLELRRAIATGVPLALEDAAFALVRSVLSDARASAPETRVGRHHQLAAEAMLHTLAWRFREPLSLEDVAAGAGLSRFHASRIFRRVVGVSIHRHLVRVRLLAALEALDQRRGDWAALALEVGFASHSHFTTAFAQAFGRPPRTLAPGAARQVRGSRPAGVTGAGSHAGGAGSTSRRR